jgi:DNA-binding response OmpR family regulator
MRRAPALLRPGRLLLAPWRISPLRRAENAVCKHPFTHFDACKQSPAVRGQARLRHQIAATSDRPAQVAAGFALRSEMERSDGRLNVPSSPLGRRELASNLKTVMEQATGSARVLVVEDDEAIADVLRRSLRAEGHEVRSACDGAEALTAAEQFSPDLVVLDLGLPRLDGMEVCRRLRAESDVPILILTARTETDDRVKGLDTGADDYLPKPFERSELLARIRALLRRRPPRGSASIVVGDLMLNPDTREVKRGEREIELTNREFELLEYLARNKKLVVSRERLLEDVWGYDPFEQTNTIDVFISNLRRKLESGGEPRLLHTKRGAGYVLKGAG